MRRALSRASSWFISAGMKVTGLPARPVASSSSRAISPPPMPSKPWLLRIKAVVEAVGNSPRLAPSSGPSKAPKSAPPGRPGSNPIRPTKKPRSATDVSQAVACIRAIPGTTPRASAPQPNTAIRVARASAGQPSALRLTETAGPPGPFLQPIQQLGGALARFMVHAHVDQAVGPNSSNIPACVLSDVCSYSPKPSC